MSNMEERESNNHISVSGVIVEAPVFNHSIFGENFYQFFMEVKRQSEQVDTLPVIISERLVDINSLQVGEYVSIKGHVRTYNKHDERKTRLLISIFCLEILMGLDKEESDDDSNNVELTGYICKQPTYRKTPLGREITDLLLAVNRPYGKSDYIPCICWGRNASFASSLEVGTEMTVVGRLQSRTYIKRLNEEGDTEQRVAYELSVSRMEVK